ncbi:exonuclease SbcCD subunit D C-terminal domain-containing protein [Sulfurimonas sp.]|uniref:exonuclease SbcCD subunit D C-terminal domain-containing protein n=1 Tax=Sulfurimonas sp. TaxID=2022749 RepID=UPI002AB04310|nr:exonuclease SbcCD subunit D C-terminal domain-containing protein [Sulfurimonas sp.]
MKILHTSDWHLGQSFMGKSRQEEHQVFLDWLLVTIASEEIDTLIVAGDIFDTGTPPNYALELYYNFLTELSLSSCENIIITAGNHDSIATLKAPKQLLQALNIHVITSGDENENEVIEIFNKEKLEGIVCAVPYLRDYVVRQSVSAETMNDKESSFTQGIKEHYDNVYKEALKLSIEKDIPIIATGHLTTVGSKTSESEREIYIGGTLDIDSDFLGKHFDYVALGHLHINQKVGCEHVRYCGSPIPLSFSESTSQKKVNIVKFENKIMTVTELDIPLCRPLLVLRGNVTSILKEFESVEDKSTWIELHLNDENPFHANQVIRDKAEELELILLAVKIDKTEKILHAEDFDVISLDELNPLDVFERRMEKDALEDEDFVKELVVNFKQIVSEVQNS